MPASDEPIPVVLAQDPLMHGEPVEHLVSAVRGHVQAGSSCVVVDLGEVRWVNSKGLGALMSGLISCRNAGGDMAIARANEKVMSLLMIAQLQDFFDTYDTVEEAVTELEDWRERLVGDEGPQEEMGG